MIHYTDKDSPVTPPKDHRTTTFQLKQNPDFSVESYRKVLSPFAGAYEAGAKLMQSNPPSAEKVRRIDTHEDPAAKEALRHALQEKFRRVYESPQSSKRPPPRSAEPASEAPLKRQIEPVPQRPLEATQAVQLTPAKPSPRAASAHDVKPRAASFAVVPQKPTHIHAQQRKASDSHIGSQPAPQDANRYFLSPRAPARPYTAQIATPPVQDHPQLACDEPKRPVDKEPPTPSGLSECSQCSGARAKGMEYICVHCENKEHELAKTAALLRDRELEKQRGAEHRGRLEAARDHELAELNVFRQRQNADMLAAMQDHNARQARLKEDEYDRL